MRKLVYGILAIAALLTGLGSAQAASITVLQDSGNLGEFTFTNTGIVSGTATIAVSAPSLVSTINTVNGAIISPALPVKVNTPLNFTVFPSVSVSGQYDLNLLTAATKTVGAVVGQQAIMGFNLTQGDTPTALPNFFNASGSITSLIANANPTYGFENFANPGSKINFTFTATSFTGTSSFAGLFSTVGATAVGNGSFSQIAAPVPEPASVVMLGAGLVGTLVVSRFRARARRTV